MNNKFEEVYQRTLLICAEKYKAGDFVALEDDCGWKCYFCLESIQGERISIKILSPCSTGEVRFHRKCIDDLLRQKKETNFFRK
jgi:hypothetical protein